MSLEKLVGPGLGEFTNAFEGEFGCHGRTKSDETTTKREASSYYKPHSGSCAEASRANNTRHDAAVGDACDDARGRNGIRNLNCLGSLYR
jgi:hypothetical protein